MKTLSGSILSAAFSVFIMVSCNDQTDYETVQNIEPVKIDSVQIVNDTMAVNSLQGIRTHSTYITQCEGFYGYDYKYAADFEREITSYKYKTDAGCGSGTFNGANTISFSPKKAGIYTFKFWSGNNTFITKTIVVE